jgi:hypothetical protein
VAVDRLAGVDRVGEDRDLLTARVPLDDVRRLPLELEAGIDLLAAQVVVGEDALSVERDNF